MNAAFIKTRDRRKRVKRTLWLNENRCRVSATTIYPRQLPWPRVCHERNSNLLSSMELFVASSQDQTHAEFYYCVNPQSTRVPRHFISNEAVTTKTLARRLILQALGSLCKDKSHLSTEHNSCNPKIEIILQADIYNTILHVQIPS